MTSWARLPRSRLLITHGRRGLGLPAEELKLDLPRRIVKAIEELGRSNMGVVTNAYGRLREGKAKPKIIPIYARIDMLASKSMKKVDCQKGCDFCCHYHVYVTPLEVFAIAEEVCSWTIGRQNTLISSLRNNVEKVQGLGVAQHRTLNLACSFLQEGACSIYAVRPLACRRHHSRNRSVCERTFHNPHSTEETPRDKDQLVVSGAFETLHAEYHRIHGADHDFYELNSALLEALTDPRCRSRWRAGKRAFLRVQDREASPI